MTAYKKHTVSKHIQYGRTLSRFQKEMLEEVQQKRNKRRALLEEVRHRRAEQYKRFVQKMKCASQDEN